MFGFGKKTAPATAPAPVPANGVKKTGYSFGFGTNTLRQTAARTAAQSSGVGPQWTYFNYVTGLFEVDIRRVGKPNFTISGKDATELKNNYDLGMSNTQSSGVGLGANAARATAKGVASVAKGTASRAQAVGTALWSGRSALKNQYKGGRSRRNRRNRMNRTRRN